VLVLVCAEHHRDVVVAVGTGERVQRLVGRQHAAGGARPRHLPPAVAPPRGLGGPAGGRPVCGGGGAGCRASPTSEGCAVACAARRGVRWENKGAPGPRALRCLARGGAAGAMLAARAGVRGKNPPLCAMARWKRPCAAGVRRSVKTFCPPADSPKIVTLSGS